MYRRVCLPDELSKFLTAYLNVAVEGGYGLSDN